MEQPELSLMAGKNANWHSYFGRQFNVPPPKTKSTLPRHLATALLNNALSSENPHTLPTAVFTIAQTFNTIFGR